MMKKVAFSVITFLLCLISTAGHAQNAGKVTLYFFYSPFCPHCKAAGIELNDFQKRYSNLTIIRHAYINQNGERDPRVVQIALNLLRGLQRKNQGKPFIFDYGVPHVFLEERGLPYYRKKEGGLKKMINVPLLIINDKAFVGFDKARLQREIINQQ